MRVFVCVFVCRILRPLPEFAFNKFSASRILLPTKSFLERSCFPQQVTLSYAKAQTAVSLSLSLSLSLSRRHVSVLGLNLQSTVFLMFAACGTAVFETINGIHIVG